MKLSDWPPSQSWLSGFILVLCLHVFSEHHTEAAKPRLTVGVILPDHSFHNRGNKIKVNKEVKNLRYDDNTVTEVYDLQPEVIFMDDYSPSEILDNMCNTILEKHVNTVLYMSNADYLGEHTASGQYLLQVCNTLGIPVIAWNADNSGFFQVSDFFLIYSYLLFIFTLVVRTVTLVIAFGFFAKNFGRWLRPTNATLTAG